VELSESKQQLANFRICIVIMRVPILGMPEKNAAHSMQIESVALTPFANYSSRLKVCHIPPKLG